MPSGHHIATIVLNYNSAEDVSVILPQLLAQEDINHTVILVDNASREDQVSKIKEIFLGLCPQGTVTTSQQMFSDSQSGLREHCYLVLSDENGGYSAGNNIGIRLAEWLEADSVLIANPDMRISDDHYVSRLADALFSSDKNLVAASRILGIDGIDQNPQKETGFWEEVLWPKQYLRKLFSSKGNYPFIEKVSNDSPTVVSKVSGCCQMLRMSFMQQTDFLDDSVFLYCEEPILSARVQSAGGQIIYVPDLIAVHAHESVEKGDEVARTKALLRSRQYYNKEYRNYKKWQIITLKCSYSLFLLTRKMSKNIKSKNCL